MTDPKKVATSPAPRCMRCEARRKSIAIEWITPGYQINIYQCPVCKNVLRLVEPRHPDSTYH